MELKYFFVFMSIVIVCIFGNISITAYNATKAGLEQCPKRGAGQGGDAIWVKSCTEYTTLIENKKESK